jgi:hypothetical protein
MQAAAELVGMHGLSCAEVRAICNAAALAALTQETNISAHDSDLHAFRLNLSPSKDAIPEKGVNMQHVRLALQEFLHNKAMILSGGV